MLTFDHIVYRIAGRTIFDDTSAAIPTGHKVGLVGRNGTGKTTLLRLINGDLSTDGGDIRKPAAARIGYLQQEAPEGADSVLDTVLAADTERLALLARMEDPNTDPHDYAPIHERLEAIDAYRAPARAGGILHGLGFTAEMQARGVGEFSGGWRMRVALAAILFAEPEILLLDEPTNHLDIEAVMWLETYLKRYRGTVVIVSHDRDFLNRVPDGILHLENQKLRYYTGTYDTFERTRAMALMQQAKFAQQQELKRKHMQAFVDRFKAKASKARQAQSRMKALAKLEAAPPMMEEAVPDIRLPEPEELASPMLVLEDAEAGYQAGKPILRHLTLRLDYDDRIGLLGSNGNGKSTLARTLAGKLPLLSGQRKASAKLKCGFFAQHQMDELSENQTAFQQLAEAMPKSPEPKVRARLGQFGFSQDKANVIASKLSGGEKARLLLAIISADTPQLLILDEPTNHLDMDTREALVEAINDFPGAVILISHDRHLVELCVDRLWLVADGTAKPFDGDLDDYAAYTLRDRSNGEGGKKKADKINKKDKRQDQAKSRESTADIRKAAAEAEKQMEKLQRDKKAIEAKLADPKLYAEDKARVVDLGKQRAALDAAIAKAEAAWIEAQGKLEAAE